MEYNSDNESCSIECICASEEYHEHVDTEYTFDILQWYH